MRPIDADALTAWMIGELRMIPNGVFNTMTGRQAANLIGMAIDEAPTVKMPGWISVKDRLPEYTGWYLTYHHKINLCVVSWFTGDGWEDGAWGAFEDGWVSHWMPLPEDPKEVSGDADAAN